MREAKFQNGKYFVVGGAGFIGSHFVDKLLSERETERVTVYDNFSSGRHWHLEHHQLRGDARLHVIHGEAGALESLVEAMRGHATVIHLASNPDIARAATDPEIDFYQGTLLTNNVVEAMRRTRASMLLYASGSGVYGELDKLPWTEESGPLQPVSTYGASKLAGEALIASYAAMFGMNACAFRFGNVVGARQTHGVGYDFLRRLAADPSQLRIMGDGRQSKDYVHVSDVVEAVLHAGQHTSAGFAVYNVGTEDAVTVTEIARMAVAVLGIRNPPFFDYTGGDRGWKGDVPVVRLDTTRLRSLGWSPKRNSREAVAASLREMAADERVLGKHPLEEPALAN
ncbi:NAD-dependent epimerase/dehydratase family protein [Silvibacterium acidisoli]|uniref:NAD-dependent epimerase/dehydratase family protein n=1 Tax=Acidobacteriaceae bacterium ZG23-2 TaxID=2883246 RepID=UPI00406CB6E5